MLETLKACPRDVSQPPRTPGDSDLVAALALLKELEPALRHGLREKQNDVIQRLAALRAPMGDQWQALARLALQNGEVGIARSAFDVFVSQSGDAPGAQYQKASMLEQAGALREAYDLMCSLPENVPAPAANAYSRGTAALFLGEKDEARRQLERAIRLNPAAGPSWLSLAMAVDLGDEPGLAERIIAAERDVNGPPEQLAAYCYAQGKAYADIGESALAFAAFDRGARTMKSVAVYDRVADRAFAEESLTGYTGEAIRALSRQQTEPTGRSIFVIGLPRSGTTLVQQILTSHSAVGDGAEVSRLVLVAGEIRGHSLSALETYAAKRGVAKLGQLWRHWLNERFPQPGRIVDKSLDTTRFIGLAAATLPEAPLIWLTRDPLDRAWSCFRTFFAAGLPWTFDLDDIAFHFRLEDRLLARWQDILSERLLVVPFEGLVSKPDDWIRRILSHCGLTEEPQTFAPHRSNRTVTTASVTQVRHPISRKSVGAAEPYRQFLQPFLRAYEK